LFFVDVDEGTPRHFDHAAVQFRHARRQAYRLPPRTNASNQPTLPSLMIVGFGLAAGDLLLPHYRQVQPTTKTASFRPKIDALVPSA